MEVREGANLSDETAAATHIMSAPDLELHGDRPMAATCMAPSVQPGWV